MNNSHLNNFYFNKYNKYKEKYLKLKNQIGGTIVDNINSIVYTSKTDLTHQLYELVTSNLDISDRFLDLEYFKGLVINDELITKIIILLLLVFKKDKHIFLNISNIGNDYYKQLRILFKISLRLGNKLLELVNDKKTLILVPGDSPSYFIFIMRLIDSRFNNTNIIIKEFPISSIGPALEKNKEEKTSIIQRYLNEHVIKSRDFDQIVIMDYSESGDSVKNLTNIIKLLGITQKIINFNINDMFRVNQFVIDQLDKNINLIQPTLKKIDELQLSISEYQKEIDDLQWSLSEYQDDITTKDILKKAEDLQLSLSEYQDEIDDLQWSLSLYQDDIITKDEILKKAEDLKLDEEIMNNNNILLLHYFVNGTINNQRCQYQLKPLDEPKSIKQFIEQPNNMHEYFQSMPQIKQIYFHCNLLKYLFYIYSIKGGRLIELTEMLKDIENIKQSF